METVYVDADGDWVGDGEAWLVVGWWMDDVMDE
jgi:hypothetical protein